MALRTHSTCYPGIYFGGGNLFRVETLSHFDGLLAFVYGGFSPLHSDACSALMEDRIPYPHILYGADPDLSSRKPNLRMIPKLVWKGLDRLSSAGCRSIGFHGAEVVDDYYVDGARTCLRAICEWIDRNPGKIDRIVLVDAGDDYYHRFGDAKFLIKRGIVTINPKNPFEEFFERDFMETISDMAPKMESDEFPYKPFMAISEMFRWPGGGLQAYDLFNTEPIFSSVSAFYVSLIPQVIAKVTGKMAGMYAFSRCAQWPLVLCGLGGHMSPFEIMKETFALPDDNMREQWAEIIEEEFDYFTQITKSIILAYLWSPDPIAYKDLREIAQPHLEGILSELRRETSRYISFSQGGPCPNNYYI